MQFDIITIFPKIFDSYFNESIIKRAQQKNLVKINIHNLRDYTFDKHKTAAPAIATRKRCGRVDDRPYGGGSGMVLMVEPINRAVKSIKKVYPARRGKKTKVILMSAKGKKFNQAMAKRFSKLDQLILISGRYEGIDERVAKYVADQEVSIGDYILTGGELPTMVLLDSVIRLISGVIAKESLKEESFSKGKNIEYPHYTRLENVKINGKERKVPKVLLSGNHKKIEEWRAERAKVRPEKP